MRLILLVGCIALSACNTTTATNSPEPQHAKPAPVATPVDTRAMTFTAEIDGAEVAANCTVQGSDFSRTFVTPAKLEIPVDATGRAVVSFVSCDAAGMHAEADDIPGPETKTVKARFGGSGLFGDRALLFGPSGNIVQYFVRNVDEGVIRVGRAPDP